jgi:hypothetical protein
VTKNSKNLKARGNKFESEKEQRKVKRCENETKQSDRVFMFFIQKKLRISGNKRM